MNTIKSEIEKVEKEIKLINDYENGEYLQPEETTPKKYIRNYTDEGREKQKKRNTSHTYPPVALTLGLSRRCSSNSSWGQCKAGEDREL